MYKRQVLKEGESVHIFNITEKPEQERKDRAVQTKKVHEQEEMCELLKDFPNLCIGGGLLPDPEGIGGKKEELQPLEWTGVVYPCNQHGRRRVIRPNPSLLQHQCEGDWVRHPC